MAEQEIVDKLLDRLENTNKALAETKKFEETARFAERLARDETGSFEILSKEFELPLKIKGTAISEGNWNGKFYEGNELRKAVNSLVDVPITVDHPWTPEDNEPLMVMDEVGKVTEAEWNDSKNAVDFEGMIVDEEIARRVYHDLVDTVSVGIGPRDIDKSSEQPKVTNMNFFELSLVKNPACKDAKFDVLSQAIYDDKKNESEVKNSMAEEEKNKESEENEEESREQEMVLVPKDALEKIGSDDLIYKIPDEYKYPYYYPYRYPYRKSDDESIEEVRNRMESLENAVKDILTKLDEEREAEEAEKQSEAELKKIQENAGQLADILDIDVAEVKKALGQLFDGEDLDEEKSKREEELENKVEELSEQVEKLSNTPDRKSEATSGGAEQLSEDQKMQGIFEFLRSKE